MKVCVMSYSMSNNNELLAKEISEQMDFDLLVINEMKNRNMMTIVLDVLFGRIPEISNDLDKLDGYDLVLLMGPVWMQKFATPFRGVLKTIKKNKQAYSVISVCGGALNTNPKLIDDIKGRGGDNIQFLKQFYLSDFIKKETIKMSDTSDYKLNSSEVKSLAEKTRVLMEEMQVI